jgi:hypothetical protein
MSAIYITWSKAIGLSGKTETEIAAAKEIIIEWVEKIGIELFLGRDFAETIISTNDPELHNIGDNQDTIILKNFPVVSISRLRDNIQSSVAADIKTLIEHTDFEVDKDSGIVQLIKNSSNSIFSDCNCLGYFTEGRNTVDVAYTHGFDTIPNDICAYADILAAKIISLWDNIVNKGGVESFRMADYEESIGNLLSNITTIFDNELNLMRIKLYSKYGKSV